MVPAIKARRQDGRVALVSTTRSGTPSRSERRTLNGLVVAEITLAAVLLVGSGLLVRAYQNVRAVDPGFRADGVFSFRLELPSAKYPKGADHLAFYGRLFETLGALPGVDGVAAVTCPPLGCHTGNFFDAEGEAPRPDGRNPVVLTRFASPGYRDVMGIPLRHGRFLNSTDGRLGGPRSVVVNESFAKLKWPNVDDPTGRWIGSRSDTSQRFTVVGVLGDVRHYGLDQPARPGVYFPLAALGEDGSPPGLAVVAHTRGDPGTLAPTVAGLVRAIDPELPLYLVGTMRQALDRSLSIRRAYSWLMAVFSAIALALALGGIYAVLSYLVGRRSREIGIRMTLGAERRQVLSLVLRQGLGLVAVGLVLGLPLALLLSRALASLLVGVSPGDPLTIGIAVVALLATGAAAALVPARRAASVDPREVIAEE
jgi:predicted permease